MNENRNYFLAQTITQNMTCRPMVFVWQELRLVCVFSDEQKSSFGCLFVTGIMWLLSWHRACA